MSDQSTTSSPSLSASSPPSTVPTPELSKLQLAPEEVSEEDKAEAARLKAQANKEFAGRFIIWSCGNLEY